MRRTQREIEALADMFLGDAPATMPAREDRIILLIEGHLPVRGTLWRTPAAEAIAQADPGMLLEVDDRELHARRLSGNRNPIVATGVEHLIGAPDAGQLWILAGGSLALAQADTLAVDEIVLLTGIDQMAIVGAYQILKQVAKAHAPILSLIVAGAAKANAQEAHGRLAQTVHEHLSRDLTWRGTLERMDALPPAAGCTVAMPSDGVGLLVDVIRSRGLNPAPSAQATPSIPETTTQHAPITTVASSTPDIPAVPEEAEHTPSPATQPAAPAPTHTTPDTNPLPAGLTPLSLPVELPSGIRIALDSRGGMHLIADHAHATELERARHWADRHLALIAQARDEVRLDRGVMCDLIVSDVHQASDLAGGAWQIHLQVEGRLLKVDPRS